LKIKIFESRCLGKGKVRNDGSRGRGKTLLKAAIIRPTVGLSESEARGRLGVAEAMQNIATKILLIAHSNTQIYVL
jgi:hypothetical protein